MSRVLEALRRIEERKGGGSCPAEVDGYPSSADGPPETTDGSVQPTENLQLPADDYQPTTPFSQLVDCLLKRFPPDRHAVLMLTSPAADHGNATLTAALADALAERLPDEVLAVDGLSQISEPAGQNDCTTLEAMRADYRFVLIDGPCMAHPDAVTLARGCDGVFVVVALGGTGRRAARQAVEALECGGANVLGCVVTG